ncbi:uncharacterized protein LY89DRAFT_668369 [Mollisia scopiformis]|uniref:Uncharacterized protein n=1 Tax=Mollisia scopiformis TaxID=149040 RepID=A0A194XEK5_MOLSC|nr:uncharacterized protein LY89DRAFT_668369 [Mollisia scopiformis]KUJ18187.1 hypothetical protein LY89DRAFT_668369 [Mollisia scopiformis]
MTLAINRRRWGEEMKKRAGETRVVVVEEERIELSSELATRPGKRVKPLHLLGKARPGMGRRGEAIERVGEMWVGVSVGAKRRETRAVQMEWTRGSGRREQRGDTGSGGAGGSAIQSTSSRCPQKRSRWEWMRESGRGQRIPAVEEVMQPNLWYATAHYTFTIHGIGCLPLCSRWKVFEMRDARCAQKHSTEDDRY